MAVKVPALHTAGVAAASSLLTVVLLLLLRGESQAAGDVATTRAASLRAHSLEGPVVEPPPAQAAAVGEEGEEEEEEEAPAASAAATVSPAATPAASVTPAPKAASAAAPESRVANLMRVNLPPWLMAGEFGDATYRKGARDPARPPVEHATAQEEEDIVTCAYREPRFIVAAVVARSASAARRAVTTGVARSASGRSPRACHPPPPIPLPPLQTERSFPATSAAPFWRWAASTA